jgi:hypothetical protein
MTDVKRFSQQINTDGVFGTHNGLLILRHDRRRILWLGTTKHPTAEWIARQLIEACGWKQAPHYLVHDRDRSYGEQYYNETRTHLSLDRDAPVPRAVETIGRILSRPVLGGLHHQYVRT